MAYRARAHVIYRVLVYSWTLREHLTESLVNQPFDAKHRPLSQQTRP